MNKDKYKPVPFNREELMEKVMSTEEGRAAWVEAQEEFAIIDAMYEAICESGMTQKELAERMGTTQSAVSRLMNGSHPPKWETVMKLFHATGHSVKAIVLRKKDVALSKA